MLSFQFMIFDIMTGLGLKNLYSLCTTSSCTSPVTKFMTKMHCPSVVRPNLLMLNRYAVFTSRSYHNDYKWEQKGQNKQSRVRNMMNEVLDMTSCCLSLVATVTLVWGIGFTLRLGLDSEHRERKIEEWKWERYKREQERKNRRVEPILKECR